MPDGRERDRYGRKDWRERLADIPAGVRAHPRIAFVAAVLLGLMSLQLLLRPTYVTVLEVAAGDCLYIRATTATNDGADAEPAIEPFAERAPCDGSHSHEVLWVQDIGLPDSPFPDDAALAGRQATCAQTLSGLRGGDAADGLVTTVAVPTEAGWAAGARVGVCTVSRIDGGFLDRPVRELPAVDQSSSPS